MKMLFASDVHGSLYDAEKLIERILDEKPDYAMFLGDFCGYSENVIFGSLFGKIPCPYSYVRGNCDRGDVLTGYGFSAEAFTTVEKYGERQVFGTHGHLYTPFSLPPFIKSGDIFVSGHTHIPQLSYIKGINIINCGSMARPRGSDVKTYATVEGEYSYIKDSDGKICGERKLQ